MSSPTQYQPGPPPQQPYGDQAPERKGMAVAALVLGILAILGCLIPVLNIFSILLAIVGLILGVLAVRKAKQPTHGGRRMGVAGIVLSVLAIVGAILANVIFGVAVNDAANDPEVAAAIESIEEATPSAPVIEEEASEPAPVETEAPAVIDEPVVEEEPAPEPEPAPAPEPEPEAAAAGSVSQEQAVRSAESYLEFSSFSEKSLTEQLEFEGFSAEDASYAVQNIEVDWNEQAAQSAKDYLEYSSFSRQSLLDQLVFEGFSQEQAEYGVSQTGL